MVEGGIPDSASDAVNESRTGRLAFHEIKDQETHSDVDDKDTFEDASSNREHSVSRTESPSPSTSPSISAKPRDLTRNTSSSYSSSLISSPPRGRSNSNKKTVSNDQATLLESPTTRSESASSCHMKISTDDMNEVSLDDGNREPLADSTRINGQTKGSVFTARKLSLPFNLKGTKEKDGSNSDATSPPPIPPRQISLPPPPPIPPLTDKEKSKHNVSSPAGRGVFGWLRSSTSSLASPLLGGSNMLNPTLNGKSTGQSSPSTSIKQGNDGPLSLIGLVNTELLQSRAQRQHDSLLSSGQTEQAAVAVGHENLKERFQRIREEQDHVTDSGTNNDGSSPGASPTSAQSVTFPKGADEVIEWEFWEKVVEDYYGVTTSQATELNRAILVGIPATIRGTVWQSMASSKNPELEEYYRALIPLRKDPTKSSSSIPTSSSASVVSNKSESSIESSLMNEKMTIYDKNIRKDLDRTSFAKIKGFDKKALGNVVWAYACYDPEVGYTQGMCFVAAPILLNMAEEEAFALFVQLMKKYNLRDLFVPEMPGLQLRLYQFDRLLEDTLPALHVHLNRQNMKSSMYAAPWFLTIFAYKFPLQLVQRVYDMLFNEGFEGAILKLGIALMQRNEKSLMALHFETLGPFLKEKLFDKYVDTTPNASRVKEAGFFGFVEKDVFDPNAWLLDASRVKLLPEQLRVYTEEFDEKEKELKGMEILRSEHQSFAHKIRKLEQELDTINKEHVDVATDLIHMKMENRELQETLAESKDRQEDLKTTIEEMEMLVHTINEEADRKAEANATARSQEQLENLMAKNLELTRKLEAAEEIESELVAAKLQLAQVNEQHEVLTRKWNDLKKALGD